MFICPTCGKRYDEEARLTKHMLQCWKELHPYHRSKPAPRSENIETREVSNDILNFFNSFK